MLERIGFVAVALAMIYSALRVVTTKNLVHTVLWLGLVLASTAVTFLMLRAPFLASIQIILYTGGVLTLMLFGVMLTQRDSGFVNIPNPDRGRVAGAMLAGLTFASISVAAFTTKLPNEAPVDVTTQALGAAFLTEHVLAFEALSVLLLAAVLGAIVLARRSDPVREGEVDGPRIPARRRV
ncbi:MAG: NADH-quinone oxidoreductase subunit J [Deltaproteobacteria bacterium]|nr:NADH-quinone oxidoreductase subunit J [Deltaproteobacteria bacterium]